MSQRANATVTRERTKLLLVPVLTELQWVIKPQLEEWAEVRSFDVPGVGDEPLPERVGPEVAVERGVSELEAAGGDGWVVVGDGFSLPAAVGIAQARPDAIAGLALGHGRLTNRTNGPRPAINRAVMEAFGQLLENDYGSFVRHGLTQVTHGSYGDELAEQMLQRIPLDVARQEWDTAINRDVDMEPGVRSLDVPLLLAKHEGCLVTTNESFEDAVAAFPEAQTVTVPDAPSVSPEFADALRTFCEGLVRVS